MPILFARVSNPMSNISDTFLVPLRRRLGMLDTSTTLGWERPKKAGALSDSVKNGFCESVSLSKLDRSSNLRGIVSCRDVPELTFSR